MGAAREFQLTQLKTGILLGSSLLKRGCGDHAADRVHGRGRVRLVTLTETCTESTCQQGISTTPTAAQAHDDHKENKANSRG